MTRIARISLMACAVLCYVLAFAMFAYGNVNYFASFACMAFAFVGLLVTRGAV